MQRRETENGGHREPQEKEPRLRAFLHGLQQQREPWQVSSGAR